jgi:hypothetical protein
MSSFLSNEIPSQARLQNSGLWGRDGIDQVTFVPLVLWPLTVFLNLGLLLGYRQHAGFLLDFDKWGNKPRRRL